MTSRLISRVRRLPCTALVLAALMAAVLAVRPPTAHALADAALIDTLQHSSFLYFWNEANPANGMVKDRSTPLSVSSIAATGFGLSAICVAVDHGWITRDQARDRVLTTFQTFWTGPQNTDPVSAIGYKGLYYHWLDMNTARRTWDSELSTIDTALLFAGILHCREYFDQSEAREDQIRALADSIYLRADWDWARAGGVAIRMGWKPGTEFNGFGQWFGYNEAMIMYLLALGSPTHPIPGSAWTSAWTAAYNWQTQYGQSYVIFPPLFGHQYSHCWVDFRGRRDVYMQGRGIDYFENSRRATIAQHAYCVANPLHWSFYSDSLWGITASDDPDGYAAHGAPPPQSENGTLAPTAAISSMPFTPDLTLPMMRYLWNTWRPLMWGPYGWKDAMNVQRFWFGTATLGIDQGPIVLMLENYLTGSVWSRFMQSPYILAGLQSAGFVSFPTAAPASPRIEPRLALRAEANPARGVATLSFVTAHAGRVSLAIYDPQGRLVELVRDEIAPAGGHRVTWQAGRHPAGVYLARLDADGAMAFQRVVTLR